jgi:hypothetical protein
MTFIRATLRDLIQRRLWPVALLLAIALAAVPVVLGRGGDDAASTVTPPVPSTTADNGDSQKAEVTLDTSVPADRDRAGSVRDPFKGLSSTSDAATSQTDDATLPGTSSSSDAPAPAPASASPTPSTTSDATPATTPSTTSTPSTTTTPSTSTKPKTTTKAKKTTTAPKAEDKTDTYHVSLRFGVNGGKLTTIRDVARLSPLPSVTDPFFVYLGVIEVKAKSEKRAVFIVSSDATPNGEGACHPTTQDCETVELTVGQTAFFDYTAPNGQVTQYELQLAGIHKTAVKAEAKAAAAFARHSVAGAELVRDAATRNARAAAGARAYRYLPGAGLLVRAKRKHVTAQAAAATGLVPGLALVDRRRQPGIPVWHSPKKP